MEVEMELQIQDHQEQKQHLCKLCNKSFSNGKVLGGHMRSHRSTTTTAQKNQPKTKKKRKKNSIAASYSLRENPKKSWKFSAPPNSQNPQPLLQENHCKICGKGFDSSKALFGHMRHHSGRRKEPIQKSKENLKSDSGGGGDTLGLLRRKRSRRTRCNPPYSSDLLEFSSSSVNVVDGIEPDVEELALCLLMLSKGVGNFGAEFSSESMGVGDFSGFEAKSPLNIATHLEFDSEDEVKRIQLGFPEVGRFYAEVELGMPKLDDDDDDDDGKSEVGFCEQEEKVRENGLKSLKKCKIEDYCVKVSEEEEEEEQEEEQEEQEEEQEDKELMEKEGNHHQCDVCLKVFGSGQALGGHKRAHILKPNVMELEEEDENENEEEDEDDEFKAQAMVEWR